jgi:hypothetical protein
MCLLWHSRAKKLFLLLTFGVLLRRGLSFGVNGFVHDFSQRRECSVSGARFRALLASVFFSRLHLAAGVWGVSSGFSFAGQQICELALVVRYWEAT